MKKVIEDGFDLGQIDTMVDSFEKKFKKDEKSLDDAMIGAFMTLTQRMIDNGFTTEYILDTAQASIDIDEQVFAEYLAEEEAKEAINIKLMADLDRLNEKVQIELALQKSKKDVTV
jgi:hypothetical protein